MSQINAKIVGDSRNMGHRLTTFVVTFPRIISSIHTECLVETLQVAEQFHSKKW